MENHKIFQKDGKPKIYPEGWKIKNNQKGRMDNHKMFQKDGTS